MGDEDILEMLKTDLQISTTKYDMFLTNIIKLAKAEIEEEGIVLKKLVENGEDIGLKIEDGMLVQMYAAYLYRKRRGENVAMPRMLRYALNNRLLSQKGGSWWME